MFEAPSRAFLEARGRRGCALALDLGCGPGFTTRLLHDVLAPARTLGLDASEAFVAAARGLFPSLSFAQHDVTRSPFPDAAGAADLAYARFLLSHLSEPAEALRTWASMLRRGGRLLLDEVAWIRSESDVFASYLSLVEEALAARGQCLYIGPRIDGLAQGLGVASSELREHPVDPRDAASLFALNLAQLRPDQGELLAALEGIIHDGGPAITWGLRQVVIEPATRAAARA